VAVGDGQQAIERLTAERPDIVLADIAMPLADGYAVAEFVRATPAMRDVPVLLLAGAFDIVEESRVSASGARGVLVKPFEPHVVISRVKELLGLGTPSETPAPVESARLVTPAEPQRPPRTLGADPPFWHGPGAGGARGAAEAQVPLAPVPHPLTLPVTQASQAPIPVAAAPPGATQATPALAAIDPETISSALVDRIAARVVEQLADRLRDQVAEAVLDVSERLVRDEIAHIREEAARQADE
jgi:CheY-like chemotaxis protein